MHPKDSILAGEEADQPGVDADSGPRFAERITQSAQAAIASPNANLITERSPYQDVSERNGVATDKLFTSHITITAKSPNRRSSHRNVYA